MLAKSSITDRAGGSGLAPATDLVAARFPAVDRVIDYLMCAALNPPRCHGLRKMKRPRPLACAGAIGELVADGDCPIGR
jgi:hypothetical protein